MRLAMPSEIYLIKVGMTMTEGIVDEWYVSDGNAVEQGEPLYRLETEKVNMDVEAELAGIVRHVAPVGQVLAPGDVVGWIFDRDEPIPEVLPPPIANPNIDILDQDKRAEPFAERSTPASTPDKGRVRASPAARRLARERNVSLADVVGTGPGGRITERDIPQAKDIDLASAHGGGPRDRVTKTDIEQADLESQSSQASTVGRVIPLTGMRKSIADRMYRSLQSTAQLTIDMEAQMDDAMKLRLALLDEWEESGVKVTYTDLIVAAAVKALQRHERMNAVLRDDAIHLNENVNIGIAVALDDGLIVPVIHNAESKSLQQRAHEAATLVERARAGTLQHADVTDGTFTVTSLGMYGVDGFTPILNASQTGILGVGRIYDSTHWLNNQASRVKCLRLSLTWDHRVLDGVPAAEFLGTVRGYLEAPHRLLV